MRIRTHQEPASRACHTTLGRTHRASLLSNHPAEQLRAGVGQRQRPRSRAAWIRFACALDFSQYAQPRSASTWYRFVKVRRLFAGATDSRHSQGTVRANSESAETVRTRYYR